MQRTEQVKQGEKFKIIIEGNIIEINIKTKCSKKGKKAGSYQNQDKSLRNFTQKFDAK